MFFFYLGIFIPGIRDSSKFGIFISGIVAKFLGLMRSSAFFGDFFGIVSSQGSRNFFRWMRCFEKKQTLHKKSKLDLNFELRKNLISCMLFLTRHFQKKIMCVSYFLNQYRRGLETCPQAKPFKSERSATTLFSSLFFDASERRVWLSAEFKILAFTFERFRLYGLNFYDAIWCCYYWLRTLTYNLLYWWETQEKEWHRLLHEMNRDRLQIELPTVGIPLLAKCACRQSKFVNDIILNQIISTTFKHENFILIKKFNGLIWGSSIRLSKSEWVLRKRSALFLKKWKWCKNLF